MKFILLSILFVSLVGVNVSSFSSSAEISTEIEQQIEDILIDSEDFLDSEDIEELSIIGALRCNLCRKALNKVMEKIPKGAAKEKIKQQLNKMCEIIPTQVLKRKCRASIEKRGDAIAEAIANNLSSGVACKIIAFC